MSRVQKDTGPEEIPHQDPLGLDDEVEEYVAPLPVSMPTGLSEEEDALRHIVQRFNPDLLFCRNCEVTYEALDSGGFDELLVHCPRCEEYLAEVGSKPLRGKHT